MSCVRSSASWRLDCLHRYADQRRDAASGSRTQSAVRNLNLNNLAMAPLAPMQNALSGPDARDVCWSNQSMWVAAPLSTRLRGAGVAPGACWRLGTAASVLPLLSGDQRPGPVLLAHPYEFGWLPCWSLPQPRTGVDKLCRCRCR